MSTREEQMKSFGRLLDVLDELREKCPWDRKQTNESLRNFATLWFRMIRKISVRNWAMYCST